MAEKVRNPLRMRESERKLQQLLSNELKNSLLVAIFLSLPCHGGNVKCLPLCLCQYFKMERGGEGREGVELECSEPLQTIHIQVGSQRQRERDEGLALWLYYLAAFSFCSSF